MASSRYYIAWIFAYIFAACACGGGGAETAQDHGQPDQVMDAGVRPEGDLTVETVQDAAAIEKDANVETVQDALETQGDPHTGEIAPDVQCTPPLFPDDCSQVSEFQCGFQGECTNGVISVSWHHHWFCNGIEDIAYFQCHYQCPFGCKEITTWPADGKTLVAEFCSQCAKPSDCIGLEHPACVGYWECSQGECVWECDSECVPEGGSVPVVPNAPDCCPGLSKIGCEAPDQSGQCTPCVGASFCTYCGDGDCGLGENRCNCPSDCKGECLGLGGKFMSFDVKDKCCEGLVPSPDCIVEAGGLCACPDCPCYICLACGDGICGPYEHECNCPSDCPPQECVEEGEAIPQVPIPPQCCPGLVKVPCDAPNEQGLCELCEGPYLCANCGDGKCGKGENICNCPADCGGECIGLGGTFLDFNTAGKCCEGLTAKHDCQLWQDNTCSCPKCPCYICLSCGDGFCGPFEHICNCPEDCPTAEKCVPTKKSACQGNPYGGQDPAGKLKIEVVGNNILLSHEDVVLNCCWETTVCYTPKKDEIEVVEHISGGNPCFCQCLFNISAVLEGIRSGTYKLTLFNEEQNNLLFEQEVIVP